MSRLRIKQFNEWFALWVVTRVGTMGCAYVFGLLALMAFPQAWHQSFDNGFEPLPIVTWLSQSLLQLVLLSIIMVGQDIQSRGTQAQAQEQHAAVMEILADVREAQGYATEQRSAVLEILADVREAHEQLGPALRRITQLLDKPK